MVNHAEKSVTGAGSVTGTIAKAMLLILLLSVVTTSIAIVTLAWSLNDAEAVNVSGSMRMQSYRLAYDIQSHSGQYVQHIENFEASIHAPSMSALRSRFVPEEIQHSYQQIILRWQTLKAILQSDHAEEYLNQVASFVAQIDHFVFLLQRYSERKLIDLAWVGALGLGGILLISVYVVRFIRREVVKPLKALLVASRRIQNRNFDVVLSSGSQSEMGILTRTFNHMAQDLGKLYRGLEQAVDEKTRKLQYANHSLKVLYDSSQELTASRITRENFQAILKHIKSIDGIKAVRLEVGGEDEISWTLQEGSIGQENLHMLPMELDQQHLGCLYLEYTLPSPDQTLVENFSQILARAVFFNRSQRQAEQLLLMEERATIARELHDSLAQSLSYLKIQVVLLKRTLAQCILKQNIEQQATAQVEAVITDIDNALSSAYTQLRELLTTFRLTIKEGNFAQALEGMVQQLGEHTEVTISLENVLSSLALDAHQQVHLLQLIREATLNAIKHAQASRIEILCRENETQIVVTVSDDGIGFNRQEAELNHYGMTIMRERASRLGGELSVESTPDAGCTVTLVYQKTQELS
ncbi:nitrate/nitrite two-component system sensor histidine kinase NarQ [Vibrio mangrovi]|uniref:Sensor protein n=1 Tax=Vibrio mangrovi TaxID=474394 RepID=A0A1Y6IX18_9VIBR|nr:nitrate/nitrite two-component system sensor histidine kinase NarQ [Vibrio mangrovi]MDW6005366.1 nitrate/nitrite two-component system sensor histidine kinase NarQ [Vibrio mangrovi]SMS02194.1 Nitrate/nitrite sensor protein NarX [Vibrio mangrovi]